MGSLAHLERKYVWGGLFGIADKPGFDGARDNLRPALYRPVRAGSIALSRAFPGDPYASPSLLRRRRWGTAAILVPEPESWQRLLHDHPGDEVIVAAAFSESIVMAGCLASRECIGTYEQADGTQVPAHAMRLGPDAAGFALGLRDRSGVIRTPDGYLPVEGVDSVSNTLTPWISLEEIGFLDGPFERTYIS